MDPSSSKSASSSPAPAASTAASSSPEQALAVGAHGGVNAVGFEAGPPGAGSDAQASSERTPGSRSPPVRVRPGLRFLRLQVSQRRG